ncbi:Hypothetical_protein [Hexamita inflata]|uniref:Hypothetical_protein n=1 Tax=Hexamita inflata TaxID=28002 RepID=A0AA86QVI0_9EUKA|nr:Hypothetical protein HINF_LOCUS54471 [Hexamita inflata]
MLQIGICFPLVQNSQSKLNLRCDSAKSVVEGKIPQFKVLNWHHQESVAAPANSSLINGVCTCNKIKGQEIINSSCQCPSGLSVVNDSCEIIDHADITDAECSQEVFTTTFDIQSVTTQITTSNNFSAGYVFGSASIIQNSFIEVSDDVYSTTFQPLFQSQSIYINLKIQFGTQSLNSGSLIISSCISIVINQLNIISKSGGLLTVNSAKQLNILTTTSISSNISNFLVNLSFAPSSGNITLISYINGVLNITGYQILGTYVTTLTVSMIGLAITSATVNVNQVCFNPNVFDVGNGSSFLFGNATTKNIINIKNFVVILGNSSNFLLIGSISTTTSQKFQCGGIIANIYSNSILSVNNVMYDSYLNFSSSYVVNSGFLVGLIKQNSNSISINNACLQQNMTSTGLQFIFFGLIAINYGNISIFNASVKFNAQTTAYFNGFGIIGYQQTSLYAEVINLRTFVSLNASSGEYIGSIVGAQNIRNFSVSNTTVGGNISSGSKYVGGFIGSPSNSNNTVQNSTICKMTISGKYNIGSFVGWNWRSQLNIINSIIEFVHISGSNCGVAVGVNDGGRYLFSGSTSFSNYINNVQQNDCTVLSKWNGAGC